VAAGGDNNNDDAVCSVNCIKHGDDNSDTDVAISFVLDPPARTLAAGVGEILLSVPENT
jgi:hypothetical protein